MSYFAILRNNVFEKIKGLTLWMCHPFSRNMTTPLVITGGISGSSSTTAPSSSESPSIPASPVALVSSPLKKRTRRRPKRQLFDALRIVTDPIVTKLTSLFWEVFDMTTTSLAYSSVVSSFLEPIVGPWASYYLRTYTEKSLVNFGYPSRFVFHTSEYLPILMIDNWVFVVAGGIFLYFVLCSFLNYVIGKFTNWSSMAVNKLCSCKNLLDSILMITDFEIVMVGVLDEMLKKVVILN